MALAPDTKLGAYRVLEPLGSGGMGEVYLAHDPRLDRRVAIKLLPERLAGHAVARERLRREALAAAALEHPFICKVFEVAEDAGVLYFVMEYVRGRTLAARLRDGPLPLDDSLRLAGEIGEAVEEAHASGLIHRDLKPGNIMLTSQGHAKVMDFGLAKRIEPAIEAGEATLTLDDRRLTGHQVLLGTPGYMAPEQAKGLEVDARADLFSFGVMLAEMLSGRHPFQRPTVAGTIAAVLGEPPDLSGELPQGLMILVRRLLAKEPPERYASMREVRADLARLSLAPAIPEPERLRPDRVPLIGRDAEREILLGRLEEALAGSGCLVMIGGEPGIGKTHLIGSVLEVGRRRGALSLIGHCYEMEGAPPYVPFIEMLEHGARISPRETFRRTLGEAAPEVARLMPELRRLYSDIPPPAQVPPEQQRRYLFNAYREFVDRSAQLTPIVAVFEDLHWADESTLLLLQHLAQTVATVPVLMIGTYRDVELDVTRPFAETLENLQRLKLATRLPLRRLPLAGVEEMLAALSGQRPPQSLSQAIFEETDGNPFFVEEVFRHLAEEGRLFDASGAFRLDLGAGDLEVPESVRLVLGRRLERLGEEARRILTTAAVIGRVFPLPLLDHLESAAHPDAALNAVEEAERARLVAGETAGREPRYRFVHELVRQTLAETLSLPRRQRLHARIAGAIERIHAANPDSQASALAHHLYQAGAAAPADKAVDWLERAARQAFASAGYREALSHVENALLLLEDARSVQAAELHALRATVLRSFGRATEAISAYRQALDLFASQGATARFAETSVPLQFLLLFAARLGEARAVSDRALELLGPDDSPQKAALFAVMAQTAALSDEIDTALSLLAECQRLQRLSGDPVLTGRVLAIQAHVRLQSAELDLAEEAARQAEQAFAACGEVWEQADVAWIRGHAVLSRGHLDDLDSMHRRHLTAAERIGHVFGVWCYKFQPVSLFSARGDLESAERAARELVNYGRSFHNGFNHVAELSLASVLRQRGRTMEALELCRRAMGLPWHSYSLYSAAHLSLTLAQMGDPEAPASLRNTLELLSPAGRRRSIGTWEALLLLIEGLAWAGLRDEACGLGSTGDELVAAGWRLASYTGVPPRTAAGIAAACGGDWTRAETHYRTAIEQTDAIPHHVARSVARYWYAEMLAGRDAPGDSARARAVLSEALDIFEVAGMPLYARRASEMLTRLPASRAAGRESP